MGRERTRTSTHVYTEDDDCEKMTTPTTLRDVGTSAKVKAAQVSYSSVRVCFTCG